MYDNDSINSSPYHHEADATQLYGQPLYPQQNRTPPTPSPEPPRRRPPAGGMQNVAMLLAVAIISATAGAGGAYAVLGNYDFPDYSESAAQTGGDTPIATTTGTGGTKGGLTQVVHKAADSVVEIYTETMQATYFGQYITEGAGSGIVVSGDGYIVTNNHVIEGARSITIRTGDGIEYEAELVGTDFQTDLAVLKIEAENLKAATFANSDNIEVGEVAVVIGNPLGTLGGSVTDGIISAKDREIALDNQTLTLLQTSAAINPGNSGGGLFNGDGDLVGIIVAKSSGNAGGTTIEGLGFAIPSNLVESVAQDIISKGYVSGRPQIGISIREISDQRTAAMFGVDRYGVYVLETAANNNLEVGDLIYEADGITIASNNDLANVLANHAAGDVIDIKVLREGREMSVNVPLSEKIPEHIQEQIKAA